MKPVTIKDIAKRLNISTSTVSRALADRWDVNPETRRAVLEMADQLHYKPNLISLGLRSNQSFSIGVIIPEFVNSFFAEVINGINSVLVANNYQVLICQSNESWETEKSNIRFLESRCVDGFLVSVSDDRANCDYFRALIEKGVPVVFFNRVCDEADAPEVIIDDRRWAFEATDHLIREGCRRIVHLTGPDNLSVSILRKAGYLDALAAHGIEAEESLIVPAGLFLEDGAAAAMKILAMEERPDGLFAITDPVAIGAMKTLRKRGVRIPEEIAVVGFSESPMAAIVEPELTSVEQPTFEIGAAAARILLEWLHEGAMPRRSRKVVIDASLNIRESSQRTAAARSGE